MLLAYFQIRQRQVRQALGVVRMVDELDEEEDGPITGVGLGFSLRFSLVVPKHRSKTGAQNRTLVDGNMD